jgi:large subunit ribosomal protein L25
MVVELTIGETKKMAVVKELQFHPVSEQLLHIDFLEVTENKPVTVAIPVQLQGHAEGVKAGGKLSLEMRKLKVNGIYTQIPNRVEIDITDLGLGKKLYVGAVKVAEGLKLMNPADACVARVKATRASQQAAAAETKGKKK